MSLLEAICWANIAEGIAKAAHAAVARKIEDKLFIFRGSFGYRWG
jgi:hypothetical protein